MDQELEDEKDDDNLEDIKSEQKSLLIILGSLVGISLVVILGIFIFFPFNSSNEPAIIVEKQDNKTAPYPALEENGYIANLNQTTTSINSTKPNQEEFFLEISPEGISTPLANSPQGPDNSPLSTSSKENKQPATVPAKVVKPENINKTIMETDKPSEKQPSNNSEIKKEVPSKSINEEKKVTEVAKVVEKPTPTKNVFWIQIGSYSDEKLANNAIEKLKIEGFESQKFKFNNDNKILNRVRMGPYETKSEANKFLNWIQENNDFKESYIVESKA